MPDKETLARLTTFSTASRDARGRNANEADTVTGKTVEVEIEEAVTEIVGASPMNDLTPNVPAPPTEVKQ